MADFDDGKDDDALRTIGEVSDGLGIKPHVLRYWEQQFSLLKPLKRSGGRRYYRPADVAMVEAINQLVNEEGYTLKGAEAVLRSNGGSELDRRNGERRAGERRAGEAAEKDAPTEQVNSPAGQIGIQESIAKLKSIRGRLADAIRA